MLCDNLEGWDGVGDGKEVCEGGLGGRGHIYAYGWFTLMYGKNQCNTIKQLLSY